MKQRETKREGQLKWRQIDTRNIDKFKDAVIDLLDKRGTQE